MGVEYWASSIIMCPYINETRVMMCAHLYTCITHIICGIISILWVRFYEYIAVVFCIIQYFLPDIHHICRISNNPTNKSYKIIIPLLPVHSLFIEIFEASMHVHTFNVHSYCGWRFVHAVYSIYIITNHEPTIGQELTWKGGNQDFLIKR